MFSISRDFMDNYSPLCAFVTIFEVFCLEIVTLVYHWRNIFPGLGQIITPGGYLQTRQYLKNLQIFEGGRGDSEYGLLVVFIYTHCRVMQLGLTIPNLVFTSRVLFSDTHYPLITRITIMSSTVFILIIVYLQMSTLLLL